MAADVVLYRGEHRTGEGQTVAGHVPGIGPIAHQIAADRGDGMLCRDAQLQIEVFTAAETICGPVRVEAADGKGEFAKQE